MEQAPMAQVSLEEGSRKRASLEQRMTVPLKTPKVLEPIETDLPSSARFKLTESRHVVIEKFRELPYVKIRDYHQVKKKGFPLVQGRGINLRIPEWKKLVEMMPAINRAVEEFEVS